MLRKRINGAAKGAHLARSLAGVTGSAIDRRAFFRRSGIAAGGLAAMPLLGATTVKKAEAQTALASEINGGICLQGELQIVDNELRFLGGGVYETARYNLNTLNCLNAPQKTVTSQYRTAFYPYYPTYGKFVSLEHRCGDGNVLCHDAGYDGGMFGNLSLQSPAAPGIWQSSPPGSARQRWPSCADSPDLARA